MNWITINHTNKCYAYHATRAAALRAAKALRALGSYATVWTTDDAVRLGQLRGLHRCMSPD